MWLVEIAPVPCSLNRWMAVSTMRSLVFIFSVPSSGKMFCLLSVCRCFQRFLCMQPAAEGDCQTEIQRCQSKLDASSDQADQDETACLGHCPRSIQWDDGRDQDNDHERKETEQRTSNIIMHQTKD